MLDNIDSFKDKACVLNDSLLFLKKYVYIYFFLFAIFSLILLFFLLSGISFGQ